METRRISRIPSEFSSYVSNTNTYLNEDSPKQVGVLILLPFVPVPPPVAAVAGVPGALKNWQRLWLTPAERDRWSVFMLEYNALYAKYSNKKESRTTAIREKVMQIIEQFIVFASPILDRISGNLYVTIDDLDVFHIKSGFLKDTHPTRHRVEFKDMPYFTLTPIGGGDEQWHVRPTKDTKRASMLKGAELDVAFIIQNPGVVAPQHINQLTQRFVSTKSIFMQHCGEANQSRVLYAACRWIDPKDPARNGPWSGILMVVIA